MQTRLIFTNGTTIEESRDSHRQAAVDRHHFGDLHSLVVLAFLAVQFHSVSCSKLLEGDRELLAVILSAAERSEESFARKEILRSPSLPQDDSFYSDRRFEFPDGLICLSRLATRSLTPAQ